MCPGVALNAGGEMWVAGKQDLEACLMHLF